MRAPHSKGPTLGPGCFRGGLNLPLQQVKLAHERLTTWREEHALCVELPVEHDIRSKRPHLLASTSPLIRRGDALLVERSLLLCANRLCSPLALDAKSLGPVSFLIAHGPAQQGADAWLHFPTVRLPPR